MQPSFDTPAATRQPLSWMPGPLAHRAPAARPTLMRRGHSLTVDHLQLVICTEGALWITHDNGREDHLVARGGSRAAPRARMHVHAMTDACVEFIAL